MITREEILMNRDRQYPLNSELENNLKLLLTALNKLRAIYGKPMYVSSGYRPGNFNSSAGGAKKSTHMSCQACDFKDIDGSLAKYCLDNLYLLKQCGLYLEDPRWTRIKDKNGKIVSGWTHLQIRPVNKRVFIPSNTLPVDPNFWNGKYDTNYDL